MIHVSAKGVPLSTGDVPCTVKKHPIAGNTLTRTPHGRATNKKKIESGRRDFSVNRKPAHVGRCLHCDSAHPVSHTTSAVSPLFRQEKIHTPQKWRNSIFAKTDTHSKRRPPRAATKNKPGTQNSQKRATPPPSKRVWDRILKKKERNKGYKR